MDCSFAATPTAPPATGFTPLSPGGYGLTCDAWSAMTHDQKWARISGPMSAPISKAERLAQNTLVATLVDRINLYCAARSLQRSPELPPSQELAASQVWAPSYDKFRASGDVVPPAVPSPTGMSRTAVGILSFVAGISVGAGALWLIKKPRANPYEPLYADNA